MGAENFVGRGREAMDRILDPGSLREGVVGREQLDRDYGPGAVVGTGTLNGLELTVLCNDAKARNPRFPVVMAGVIGLEEAYQMACAVYLTMEADRGRKAEEKRPLLLVVDSPGNSPGKLEELVGMNKATGAYQLALAEARQMGHPVVAMVVGRAISGAFLCHGIQADRILSLPESYGTKIHVMPLGSIARITGLDIETLEELSRSNPVFASGAEHFYRLGGLDEIVESPADMREAVLRHIGEIRDRNCLGRGRVNGPRGRGELGKQRGGRAARARVLELMEREYEEIREDYR